MRIASEKWDALFDAILAESAVLGERVSARMRSELPAYGPIAEADVRSGVLAELACVMQSARRGYAAVSDDDLSELAAVGRARGRQQVPVDQMLRAWRIAIQVVVGRARELGGELGVGAQSLLEFVESTLAWSDVAMVVTAAAHREAELAIARQDEERRAAFVRGVLLGTLAPAELTAAARAYGLDSARAYGTVRARVESGVDRRAIEAKLGFHLLPLAGNGMCTLIDGDVAGFLARAPDAEIDAVIGLGPARRLDRLSESFRLATRALVTAQGFGLVGIHDVPGLGLRAAIVADRDVGDALRARYIEPLLAEATGAELVTSLRAYFESQMHIERAAARLFVHQNTLRYRIARVESITGANLKEPRTAFEVWWALERETLESAPTQDG